MADPLPRRLVGYGAYNLCFDRLLAKKQDSPYVPDFFATIRNNGFKHINLVKVICFRNSGADKHPPGRTIPLYVNEPASPTPLSKIVINAAFLNNLVALVRRAQETGFWVQVCIFHYHALLMPPPPQTSNPETPELLPPELTPKGQTSCQRLKNFFNPAPTDPNQLIRQKELLAAIVGAVKDYHNVIFELGNELRLDKTGCTPADNCQLAEWLSMMRDEVFRVTGFVNTHLIGTSTGTRSTKPNDIAPENNEQEIFQTCPKRLSRPDYFDFHFLQWFDTQKGQTNIPAAIDQVKMYNGTSTTPPLIINDDGADSTARPDNMAVLRSHQNVQTWATQAFNNHLHYSSKQPYYNGATGEKLADFDLKALGILDTLAATIS